MDNQIPNQDSVIKQPVEPVITPLIPTPEIEITPEPEITSSEPASPEPVEVVESAPEIASPTLPPIETPPKSPEEQLQNLGISTPTKSGGGFLKGLFIIALIIFIFVMAALGLVYFKSQKTTDNSDSSFDTIETTPTKTQIGSCLLNDKTYQVGESFAAADGCNTCTCESQDIITCTEKACMTTTPTPISTSSAQKTTPTATPSAVKN